MKLLPDPKEYPENRLFCLDMLRGLDMFYLASLSGVVVALCKALNCPAAADFLGSHPWYGFTLYDIIMPLFIFMSGAAIPLALGRRLDGEGRPTAAFHKHVWSRFALLWILGMVAQGRLCTLNLLQISPYNNTLQTIAIGYIVAAYVLLLKSWHLKIAIPVVLSAIYGLVIHFCGDYTGPGNATMPVEKVIVSAIVPAGSEWIKYLNGKACYTWFLPSLMFPVIALCGAFSTILLSNRQLTEWRRAIYAFAFGFASLVAGLVLEAMGVKCVKHIFTVSFTFQAIGYSVIALAVLFVLCDIWKLRRGTGIILLYGQFALAAYLCEAVFAGACYSAGDRIFVGFKQFVTAPFASVVSRIGFMIVVTFALIVWRGYKQARKVK